MARGPAYPYINLAEAVGLAKKLYDYGKRSHVNLNSVVKEAWGYSPSSSSAVKIVAAMRYFGLIEVIEAKTADRQDTARITDRAYRILIDSEDSPERAKAIRDAMLSPKAYKLCWDIWGADLPPSMRTTLLFEHGFIVASVDQFLNNYEKSLAFAGLRNLNGSGGSDDVKNSAAKGVDDADKNISAGLQFRSTDQIKTDKPVPQKGSDEISTQTPQGPQGPARPALRLGMRQEVFVLAEGDVTISWPESISEESLEDFTDWLGILLRKVKRNVTKASAAKSGSNPD